MNETEKKDRYDCGETMLAIFQRGTEFAKQLLCENMRLRAELNDLRQRHSLAAKSDDAWNDLRLEFSTKIEELDTESDSMFDRIRSIEDENRNFAERYVEVEDENNNLANLYVASHQLHAALDPIEVVNVIIEFMINQIGAEIFCVYICDKESGKLTPVAAEGDNITACPLHQVGKGFVGESVETGVVGIRNSAEDGRPPSQGGEPIVSIPMRAAGEPVGAVVIYKLVRQKDGLSELDNELFTLLAGHAATAIFASRLYSMSERKLDTIQEFIGLLTD